MTASLGGGDMGSYGVRPQSASNVRTGNGSEPMPKQIEIRRVGPGHFIAFVDGARSKYEIWNGSLGTTGRGHNHYGIQNTETGAIKWIGSLAACKTFVTSWLNKE